MTMLFRRALLPALLLIATACASGKPLPPFEKKGEIYFASQTASFDEYRVVGPSINVNQRSDGSWAGTFGDQVIDFNYENGFLTGSNINVRVQEHSAGVVITGQWFGQLVRYEVDNNQVMVRTPNRSYTLARTGNGLYGPEGQFRLEGQAALTNPPEPAFALGMLAISTK